MPVLETRTIIFERADFRRAVRVNKDGLFHITLPKPVPPALGLENDEVVRKTKDEAIEEFDRLLKQYTQCKTTSHKVILYGFEASCTVMSEDGERCLHHIDEITFSDGTGLTFWAEVNEEIVTTQTDGRKSYQYKIVKSRIPAGFVNRNTGSRSAPKRYSQPKRAECLLDWTPQLEAAIAELCQRLVKLIMDFRAMVSSKKRFLAKLAEFKLLPMKEEEPRKTRGRK